MQDFNKDDEGNEGMLSNLYELSIAKLLSKYLDLYPRKYLIHHPHVECIFITENVSETAGPSSTLRRLWCSA